MNRIFDLWCNVYAEGAESTRLDEVTQSYFNSGGDVNNTDDINRAKALALELDALQGLPVPKRFKLQGGQVDGVNNWIQVSVEVTN